MKPEKGRERLEKQWKNWRRVLKIPDNDSKEIGDGLRIDQEKKIRGKTKRRVFNPKIFSMWVWHMFYDS
jgi:hypothetical protein